MKNTKDSSRYVPSEEPGTYNVYGVDKARELREEYFKTRKGQGSSADLSKGRPEFALWRPEVSEPNLDTAMTGFRNVTRHGNTVEAQVGSHKFMVTDLDEYTGTIPDDVVPTAKSLYEDGKVYWKIRIISLRVLGMCRILCLLIIRKLVSFPRMITLGMR